jgi:hypothetical protein
VPRILPSRPSLDQLRNQARDLLRACRAGNAQALRLIALHLPSARQPLQLSYAQFALAREYGFSSWVKLREHIAALPAAPPEHQTAPQPRGAARIALIAERLLAATHDQRFDQLFAGMAIPARDVAAVCVLLSSRGDLSQIVGALVEAAASPQDRVRFLAAQAMDHFADQRCEPVLRRLLRDPVPRVRWAAIHSIQCAMCKIAPLSPGEDMVATLINLAMHDPSIKVRRVATYELGQVCADPRATAALQVIATEVDDPVIRRGASRALLQHDTRRD